MKKLFLIFLLPSLLICQPYFQKITSGIVATDLGSYTMAAWGDYDNDGFQDLAAVPWNDNCWSCRSPIVFYRNNGNGTFSVGNSVLIDNILSCNGIAWGDFNNDGRLDVYITRYFNQTNLLYQRDSTEFTPITTGDIATDIASSTGCSWGDYDKDGWLDMFVSHGLNQNNALYHNNGNGTFTKITTGDIVNDGGDSRSCSWGDYNNDGWIDLFVVNYSGQNCFLYRNNTNGTFTKITNVAPVTTPAWGAGCSWADYDNDGWLDLLVTNNSSLNRLYHNDQNGNFTLTSLLPSQENGLSYYSAWADIDNDGYIDLFVPKRTGPNVLYKNVNGTSFIKLISEIVSQEGGISDAGAFADYDNDGKIDLFVANGSTGSPVNNYLYKNVTTNSGNYITIKLVGCVLNKSAIGAKIKVKAGNLTQTRQINGGTGSQSMLWQHFGLGNAAVIDSIIVYWTTGNISVENNVPVNQLLTITDCPVGIINNQIPVRYELRQNYPNPFNPFTQIEYSLLNAGNVKLSVFDITGKLLSELVNEYQPYGTYRIDFNGSNLASGVYIYKIQTEDFAATKKMVLVK